MSRGRVAALLLVSAVACISSDPIGPTVQVTVVEFVYQASTSIDPDVVAAHSACAIGAGQTHIHPSWLNFSRINMRAVGVDRWEITFRDVPIDVLQSIRISDPNVCADNPTGAATQNVSANAVLLTNVVDTPGSGVEPGLSFTFYDNFQEKP
ncbi:MAG: hypothetical protein O7I93_05805 [Gemmatimonadetes bacterium]|nr:hypothetical protein [Gemmatimonadota bacterium]